MNRIFKLEIKRAFRNRLFAATLCVAFAICVWHFMENVWIWRMYVYYDTYPLSAYEKWIGADNASVQPLLLYLIMPALCAIPYGRSFYFDVKSGYAAQIISRGKKSDYIRAKYGAAFVSGALIGMIPLVFDFLLTAMVFPMVIPQVGTGTFPVAAMDIMSGVFYTHPLVYNLIFVLIDGCFWGLLNCAVLWAVNFVRNRFWILLTPFMSCSAKLPIYSFFVSVFFPGKGGLIMSALYLLGIVIGILVAFLYRGTLFKGEPVPFVMELPNYRLPGAKNVGQLLWEKAKDFLQKAFTVIFIATIVVWFLQSFDLKLNLVENSANSMLAMLSGLLVPVFRPLGLGDWRICTSLISGFMAKESVVATLEVLFGSSIATVLTPLAAATLLVFSLLYTPCVAAIASVRRELGGKWAIAVVLWQCFVAWVAAFLIHGIGMLLG